MPTLDDIPILPVATPTGDDLIPISDPNSTSSSKVSAIRLNQISGLNAGEIASVAASTSPAIAISTRVLAITSGVASTLTLPAASGNLREIMVINDGSGSATLPTLAAGNETINTGSHARVLSNGTGWYRVG
jgi:hypothetical protein